MNWLDTKVNSKFHHFAPNSSMRTITSFLLVEMQGLPYLDFFSYRALQKWNYCRRGDATSAWTQMNSSRKVSDVAQQLSLHV